MVAEGDAIRLRCFYRIDNVCPIWRLTRIAPCITRKRIVGYRHAALTAVRLNETAVRSNFFYLVSHFSIPVIAGRSVCSAVVGRRIANPVNGSGSACGFRKHGFIAPRFIGKRLGASVFIQRYPVNLFSVTKKHIGCRKCCITHWGLRISVKSGI